jgi:uncharacterized protein (TIGR02118 family)
MHGRKFMTGAVVKFVVVLKKRQDFSEEKFQQFFRGVHRPLALKIPGLLRHVVNFPAADSTRQPPQWDAVVELYFESREEMEAAWRSPAGVAATQDLEEFADLSKSTWSIVEVEENRL